MCRDMKNYYSRKMRRVCVQCGHDLSNTNKTYCDECIRKIINKNNELFESRKASGRCFRCGEHLTDNDRLKNGKMAKQCKYCRDLRRRLRVERGWK